MSPKPTHGNVGTSVNRIKNLVRKINRQNKVK